MCSRFPITKALKKYKIKTRNSGQVTRKYEKILTKQILIYEYYKNNLSLKEIANKYGISCAKVVLTYFKIYNIHRRSQALGTKIRFNKEDMRTKFSKMRKGKNHWNFKNWSSKKPYTKEWTLTLKQFIRKRDNYTCAICKKQGNEVHHINYNKKDSFPNNLITLCHSCHTKTGYNRMLWELLLSIIMKLKKR
jgi:5-methylcytosine-specific restriction endonuclease McrA